MKDLAVYVSADLTWHIQYVEVSQHAAQVVNCLLRVLQHSCVESYSLLVWTHCGMRYSNLLAVYEKGCRDN